MTLKNIALKAGLAATGLLMGTAAAFAASAEATSPVNVRSGPGTSYSVVDQLYAGENVDVRACQGGWCRITHSGPDGWVSANYLTRGGDYYDDDDYYDGPDIVVRAPRYYRSYPYYRHYRPYRPYGPYGSFCVGGSNASFCISN